MRKEVAQVLSLIRELTFATTRLSGHDLGGASLRGAFALVFVQQLFAEPEIFRSGFDVFVGSDVFERPFQRKLQGSSELNAFAVTLRTHVRQFLRFARI